MAALAGEMLALPMNMLGNVVGSKVANPLASDASEVQENRSGIADERAESCRELRDSMNRNMSEYRQRLADVELLNKNLKLSEGSFSATMDSASKEYELYAQFHKEIESSLELLGHREDWNRALSTFMDSAFGGVQGLETMKLFNVPSVMALSSFLCEKLNDAEPAVDNSVGVVLWKEAGSSLKCFHAVGPCQLETGQTIRAKYTAKADQDVWQVCVTGETMLCNPHNLPEVARAARSVVPLKASDGRTMGAVVSGPPALPDECVELFARMSGQIFERAWRLELVADLIGITKRFIESACTTDRKLVYVRFETDVSNLSWNPMVKSVNPDSDAWWQWQPLKYSRPIVEKNFHLPLKWSHGGEMIGVLVVECSTFTSFDEKLLVLLHTLAPMVTDAVKKIETTIVGEWGPLSSISQMMASFEIYRCEVPIHLRVEMKHQLAVIDFGRVLAELKHYCMKVEDKDLFRLIKAFLILVGYKSKKVRSWEHVRKALKAPDLARRMIQAIEESWEAYSSGELPLAGDRRDVSKVQWAAIAQAKKKSAAINSMWDDSDACLKGIDLQVLAEKSPGAVGLLIRWMKVSRMVHNVTMAISQDVAELKDDPVADEIFDEVDADDDGLVTSTELVAYLLNQYGAAQAHKLLRSIDYNGDGSISRREWHRGYRLGAFQAEAGSPQSLLVEEEVNSRRSTGARLVLGGSGRKIAPKSQSKAKLEPVITSSTRSVTLA